MHRRLAFVATTLAALWVGAAPTWAVDAPPVRPVEISAKPIEQFHLGSNDTRFGPLEFTGGFIMSSSDGDFGGVSAFRFLDNGSRFLGVSDSGNWLTGRITRDASGRPVGIADFTLQAIETAKGKIGTRKQDVDAEGLSVRDGVATVSFERTHRVLQYRLNERGMGAPLRSLDFLVPRNELRTNRGFETVTSAHPYGQHEGGLMVVSEKSLDKAGNMFAAIISGPRKGIFTVKRDGDYDITDGAFLENGDLLILERRLSFPFGVKMRLRRLYGETIAKGEVAQGPVLLEADMGYQIDNMEALDVWKRQDGAEMVSLLSDNNFSILQRSLYLEFRLHPD